MAVFFLIIIPYKFDKIKKKNNFSEKKSLKLFEKRVKLRINFTTEER